MTQLSLVDYAVLMCQLDLVLLSQELTVAAWEEDGYFDNEQFDYQVDQAEIWISNMAEDWGIQPTIPLFQKQLELQFS